MTNNDIQKLLHILKPDGYRTSDPVLELHKLTTSIQDLFSKAHTAITIVTDPKFKGEVIGTLIPWPGHFPLELDHTDTTLNDILVRGTSISEYLAAGLWEEAEAYIKERFSPDTYYEKPKESE